MMEVSIQQLACVWSSTCLVHETEDRLHISIGGRDTSQQSVFVAPEQFVHSPGREELRLRLAHKQVGHGRAEEAPFCLVHYGLEMGIGAKLSRKKSP